MAYLTGPVNVLTDYTVEYNGLLMGGTTPYEVPPVWNFLDMASLKTMDQARVWADGSWSGPDFADVLLPEMPIEIAATSSVTFAAAVAALRNIFVPQTAPQALWVKLPGMAAMGIPAKVNKRIIPIDMGWVGGLSTAVVQWRCPDPTWQSVPRSYSLAAPSSINSGMQFPLFVPAVGTYVSPGSLDYGSTVVAASSAPLTNSGNTGAWPVVTVTGPCPSFTLTMDGNNVTYGQTIQVGQSVTVDYKTGLATLTGNVDRTYALTSRQFSPVTSLSNIFFSASAGTAVVIIADVSR